MALTRHATREVGAASAVVCSLWLLVERLARHVVGGGGFP
jgi:hypothetical protein